jgi:hypothetical protein
MPLWQPTLFPEGYLINVSKTLIKTNSQEEKAMIISDLNYMETAEANVEGGYVFKSGTSTISFNFNVAGASLVKGNNAGAEASAGAFGTNTQAQAISATETGTGYSVAGATSVSSSNNTPKCYFWCK